MALDLSVMQASLCAAESAASDIEADCCDQIKQQLLTYAPVADLSEQTAGTAVSLIVASRKSSSSQAPQLTWQVARYRIALLKRLPNLFCAS